MPALWTIDGQVSSYTLPSLRCTARAWIRWCRIQGGRNGRLCTALRARKLKWVARHEKSTSKLHLDQMSDCAWRRSSHRRRSSARRGRRLSEGEGMHTHHDTHVRVDDDAGTGDLARRATGATRPQTPARILLGYLARRGNSTNPSPESVDCRFALSWSCSCTRDRVAPLTSLDFGARRLPGSGLARGGSSGLVSVSVHGRSPLRARSPLGCLLVVGSKLDKSVIQLKQCVMRSVMRTTSARLGRL